MKGPPKSTPVCAKGRSANRSLIYGRGAIICFGKLHFFSQARISSCPDIIHNRVDRTASVWFTPLAWFPSWWKYFTINFVTWCLRGRIIGKRASWDKNSAYLSRLSHLIWPSSSNHGPKASNLLFFGSSFRHWRAKYSSGKAFGWALLRECLCKSGPVDFVWDTDLAHFLCVVRHSCTYTKTTIHLIGSLYFSEFYGN